VHLLVSELRRFQNKFSIQFKHHFRKSQYSKVYTRISLREMQFPLRSFVCGHLCADRNSFDGLAR